ncbi:MAG: M23 family metallopeptidase [Candidatus Doudnabacteria bacterium]|nr:M23 family metallopeptidase [Candidatus Doudnabacteria bacterium]
MYLRLLIYYSLIFLALCLVIISLINPDLIIEQYQYFSDKYLIKTGSDTPEPNSTSETTSDQSKVNLNDNFSAPMSNFRSRVTKKFFGTYVDPSHSPVSPEKFTGFHNAVDLETFPDEENLDVSVNAICTGKLAINRTASGYGGLVAQYCTLDGSPVLVLYGHMDIDSVVFKLGDDISSGTKIGILGQPGPETDGERKHLHLGIRKGQELVILGYVPTEAGLSNYIDPLLVIK